METGNVARRPTTRRGRKNFTGFLVSEKGEAILSQGIACTFGRKGVKSPSLIHWGKNKKILSQR